MLAVAGRRKAEALRVPGGVPLAVALRRSFAGGYDPGAFRADVLAGIVVGIVALPLSMALAIAVGVPPQHGLYTAIVAGAVAALAGGSKLQVTGPTAAFVVVLAPIVSRFGLEGLLTAGFMAGLLLVAMGVARLGQLVEFIPHPVTTGFTAGIGTVIAGLQLRDVWLSWIENACRPLRRTAVFSATLVLEALADLSPRPLAFHAPPPSTRLAGPP